jgi:hypothetical protein
LDEDDGVTFDEDERSAFPGRQSVDRRHGDGLVVTVTRTPDPSGLAVMARTN